MTERRRLLYRILPSWWTMMLFMLSSSTQRSSWGCRRRNLCHGLTFSPPPRSRSFHRQAPILWRSRKKSGETPAALSWESFDFSDSPKWDQRFQQDIAIADTTTSTRSKEQSLQELTQTESQYDDNMSRRLQNKKTAWDQLDPVLIQKGITALLPFCQPRRVETIRRVMAQRTQHTHFVFENPSNPSNVWACLRTLDAFGIQHVHVIVDSAQFEGKAALAQKRGMRTAMGSAQWLTLCQYSSTQVALQELKKTHRFMVADLEPGSQDIRNVQWDDECSSVESREGGERWSTSDERAAGTLTDRPLCIVMGNEERGVSDEMRAAADARFHLPMVGFAESLNLSVATAVTLAHLSAASSNGGGPLRPGDLPDQQRQCLLFKGLLNSVAQKRMAYALLRKANVQLPQELLEML